VGGDDCHPFGAFSLRHFDELDKVLDGHAVSSAAFCMQALW